MIITGSAEEDVDVPNTSGLKMAGKYIHVGGQLYLFTRLIIHIKSIEMNTILQWKT